MTEFETTAAWMNHIRNVKSEAADTFKNPCSGMVISYAAHTQEHVTHSLFEKVWQNSVCPEYSDAVDMFHL